MIMKEFFHRLNGILDGWYLKEAIKAMSEAKNSPLAKKALF